MTRNDALRLAAFAAAVVVVTGGSYAVGASFEPVVTLEESDSHDGGHR
jgi:hypothetical protein